MKSLSMERKSHKRYSPQDPEIKQQLRTLMRAHTGISLLALISEWTTILAVAGLSWFAFRRLGLTPVTAAIYLVAITILGSRQRALECLIHEATHVNLSRKIWLNDLLAWCFAALPLGHNLETERFCHLVGHHKNFWDFELDTDFRRYRAMGVDKLPARSYSELFRILARGFVPYVKGTLPTFFVPPGEPLYFRCTRVAFWVLLVAWLWFANLLIPLALYWIVPFLVVLTLIRYIGEASEHSALGCSDEFGTTRNNLGWFNEHFLHPRGDGYHLVHHLYPKIPFHKMAAAHRLLMKDPTYRDAGHHCSGLIVAPTPRHTTLQEMAGFLSPTNDV